MSHEEERLRRKIRAQREAFRGDFFLIFLCVGLFSLAYFVDLDTWTGFIGSWCIVALAWFLAKISTPEPMDD
jgi:hypothetical protein